MSPARKRTWPLAGSIGLLAFFTGAASVWAATDRKLEVHIATSSEKGKMMCQVAEFMLAAAEAQCAHLGASCPERPVELRPEILPTRCK